MCHGLHCRLGIYVALILHQSYRDLNAGDSKSLKTKWPGVLLRNPCSASQELNHYTTTVPIWSVMFFYKQWIINWQPTFLIPCCRLYRYKLLPEILSIFLIIWWYLPTNLTNPRTIAQPRTLKLPDFDPLSSPGTCSINWLIANFHRHEVSLHTLHPLIPASRTKVWKIFSDTLIRYLNNQG